MTAKDYVRYLLSGEFAIEVTEASGIASMDQEKEVITQEIYNELGISEYLDCIPKRILDCTEIAGGVTKECANLTGLKEGTPVVGGQMDTGASIISAGVTKEKQLGVIVGTWGINSIVKHQAVADENIFMLLLSQNIKIERCILILGINIEPDDLADLRKSINRLDVYCAASSG